MTYNIRHGAPIHKANNDIQIQGIADAINAQRPDLVALEEVDSVTQRAPIDEAKELGKLTGMHYFFSKTINFEGGEYGDAILSRYPIIKVQHEELPMPDSSGEARALGIITIKPFRGMKINFAVTHLDLRFKNRMAEIRRIMAVARQSQYPFILGGDFNAFPNSKEVKTLKSYFVFADRIGWTLTFPSDDPRITIDYIVLSPEASKEFQVTSYNVIKDISASDHLPLVEELQGK